jgi:peptide/nickel transport system permease protein
MRSLTLESASEKTPGAVSSALGRLHAKAFSGGSIVVIFILLGIFGPSLAPYDPNKQELTAMMKPPQGMGGAHVLGTDNLGRDILSRIVYGARVSLLVAFAVVFVSGLIGVILGAISGYIGGKADFLIQKLVEVVWAFPPLLLGITIMAFFGQGLTNLIFALVAQRWIPYCRVVRGQALSLRERDFVMAARCLGATKSQIIGRHILPNLIQTSLVIGTFAMASSIIAEASLSFLGVGVPPDIPTWGTMLADARIYISTSWWMPLFPGLCIFITVLGINLLGDALRDILDPRLKRTGSGV